MSKKYFPCSLSGGGGGEEVVIKLGANSGIINQTVGDLSVSYKDSGNDGFIVECTLHMYNLISRGSRLIS